MSKLFQYNVWCILIFLIISISYTPGYSSSGIQLEKEVVIDSPAIGVVNLPDQMTFKIYDSDTAAMPIAHQSFYRGEYSAYYNIAKSDGLTQKSIVRLSVEFTNLSQLGSNVDALNNLWLEVELDRKPAAEREPLDKEITKQILSVVAAQNTGGPDTSQNVTKQVSGSDGQIQYNNGGVEGGASQFYYDDVNHRVGIGTAGPGTKLHVAGGGAFTEMFVGNTATSGQVLAIGWDPSGGNPYSFIRNHSQDNGGIYLNNGNIGIGTTRPMQKLHVNGHVYFGDTFGDDNIQFEQQGTFHRIAFENLRFWEWSRSEDVMTINGGNVGIGTTAMSSLFRKFSSGLYSQGFSLTRLCRNPFCP